jgi:hypothetical protein
LELIAASNKTDLLYLFDKKPFDNQLMADLTSNASIYEGMQGIHIITESAKPLRDPAPTVMYML